MRAVACSGRDTRLIAGDIAYLVGQYRELLDTLRKGRHVRQSGDERFSAAKIG